MRQATVERMVEYDKSVTVFKSIRTDSKFLKLEDWELRFLHSLNHELITVAVEGDERNKTITPHEFVISPNYGFCVNVRTTYDTQLFKIPGEYFESCRNVLWTKFPNYNFYVRWMVTKNMSTGQLVKWERQSNIGDYDDDGNINPKTKQMMLMTINRKAVSTKKGRLLFSEKELEIAADDMQVKFCLFTLEKHIRVNSMSCIAKGLIPLLKKIHQKQQE